ncbi:MAG: 2-phospho-L-lactate transferase [Acidimicrobiales bacterium]
MGHIWLYASGQAGAASYDHSGVTTGPEVITALAGGVGAARFLAGLSAVAPAREITAVVNTGDDFALHGLHISPDIDTVTYTLAGMANPAVGWGVSGETWNAMDALGEIGGETWFRLGDRDLATHLYRSGRIAAGARLSEVTAELARARGLAQTLLPMSDDRVSTLVTVRGVGEVAFQDYFVRMAHSVEATGARYDGAAAATPAPGVLDALSSSATILVCPSNPILSILPILSVAPIAGLLERLRSRVTAISPIVAGRALKGPAARIMAELGHEPSVIGVARLYAPFASTLLVDVQDSALAGAVEREGMACIVTDTIMDHPKRAAALASVALRGGAQAGSAGA